MTVASTTNRESYTGNGTTTAFPFPNPYRASSDLIVTLRTIATGTESLQVEGVNYTVSGTPTSDAGGFASGTVTFTVAPTAAQQVHIDRVVTRTQATDYVAGDGIPPSSIEGSLDKLTQIVQELDSRFERTLLQPRTAANRNLALPEPRAADAQKVLSVNAGGTGYQLITPGGVSDGDKGDITVSGGGSTWTIDAGAVTSTALADNAVTSAKILDGTIVNADINASAAIAHSKLANITAGQVLLGNASNVPTATALSGDVTVNSSGVTAIGSGVIVDADVNASAAIAYSKLASMTGGSVLLGNASNVPTVTALTGDVTVSNAGVTAIGTGVIVTADIANSQVTYAKIQNVSATDRVLGRSTAGAGVVEEIICTAAGRALIDDATTRAQQGTLGFYDTVAAVNAATIDSSINYIRTASYTTSWPGGGGTYVRKLTNQVAPPNAANRELIYSLNGSNFDHWELVGDKVSVLQLGADPTGLTSSHVAFQAAINFLVNPPANRFNHIEVPSGNYLLTTGVTIPDGRRIKIEGLGDARIFTSSTITLFTHTRGANANFSTVHFENIWFENTAAGNPAVGVRAIRWLGQDSGGTLYKDSSVHVLNCEFRKFWRAVDLAYAQGCTFKRCFGADNTTDFNLERWASFLEIQGYTTQRGTYFIYGDERIAGVYSGGLTNTLWISDCLSVEKETDISLIGWDAVNISNGGSDLGGTLAGSGQAAIYMLRCTNINITNQYVSSSTTVNGSGFAPRENRIGVWLADCDTVKIIGNKIVDSAIGVQSTFTTESDVHLLVEGNRFRNNRLSHITATGNCRKGIISQNLFDNTPPRTVKNFDIWLNEAGNRQWNVSGNVFQGAAYTITAASNWTVVDNIWSSANIPLTFRTNDTDRLTITAAGKVGINSTAPNGNLEVVEPLANNTGHIVVYSDDDPSLTLIRTSFQAWTAWVDASDGNAFKIGGSNSGISSAVPYLTITAGSGAGRVTANAPEGLGYGTGAGGVVTQATSKATGVTLNAACGQITMNNAALAANTTVSFVLTNSKIAATDVLILNHVSGGTPGSYLLNARAAAGSATIDVRNITAGSLSEAIVLGFAIMKAVTA